jgi:hypothetical protein
MSVNCVKLCEMPEASEAGTASAAGAAGADDIYSRRYKRGVDRR